MKKYILFGALFALVLAACNPNEEIYENIDNQTKPYKVDMEIALKDADYTVIKNLALKKALNSKDSARIQAIDTYKSFGYNRKAGDFVGAFLDQTYLAPDSASTAMVTYKYALNEYDSLVSFSLKAEDYTEIGGAVADSAAFSWKKLPGTYLPNYLKTKDTISGYVKFVTCKYIKPDFSRVDTNLVYTFADGVWALVSNAYVLTTTDYKTMGTSGGLPGQYGNFSSTAEPAKYLPTFMEQKFAYAFEGNTYAVFYKYYAGTASVRMEVYGLGSEGWKTYETKTEQFIHNGTQWLFDPTVTYSIVKSDYSTLIQYIMNHETLVGYLDQEYMNTEYYFGASEYYQNFDMRVSKRRQKDPLGLLTNMSDEEASTELKNRLKDGLKIVLEASFPTQQPVTNGVEVYYEIIYKTYEPGYYFYKMRYKCTDVGKFEYAAGPFSLQ